MNSSAWRSGAWATNSWIATSWVQAAAGTFATATPPKANLVRLFFASVVTR